MSFERVNRNWRSLVGRAFCVLGLSCVLQFAYAAQDCTPVPASEDCMQTSAHICAANEPCIVLGAPAASPSYDPPPSVDAPRHAATYAVPILQQGTYSGLSPGFPSPVYIRFRRYLS